MKISEIFYSIQGEGILNGVPSAFVRTTGCNLRCVFCDSPQTSWNPEGETLSLDDIVAKTNLFNTNHVVITGGEPFLHHDLNDLCKKYKELGYHITLETAGTIFQKVQCNLLSISPKLSNSTPHHMENGKYKLRHDELRLQPDVVKKLMEISDYQLKFVIDSPEDTTEVREFLKSLGKIEKSKVLLMPQGITREDLDKKSNWLVELCKEEGFRYCPRLHIDLYGNTLGT
jgi:7-carboxy-7-deazaguanine synthase